MLIKWQGLKTKRFRPYRKWINSGNPGICGSFCVSVMLDDFLRQTQGFGLEEEAYIKGVKPIVDDYFPYKGTFLWDIKRGLDYFMKKLDQPYRAKTHLIPDLKVKELLDSDHPRPLIVGTTKLQGSKYGNHWVLVYQYGYSKDGDLYFKGYDNHGRYASAIPARETLSVIWLEKVDGD